MQHKLYVLVIFVCGFLFNSCRDDMAQSNNPEDYIVITYEQIFEAYWNGMNNNYVFWDIETTGWDAIHTKYKPLFAKLDIDNPKDAEKAHEYFTSICQGLIDSHYKLSFINEILPSINPGLLRLQNRDNFHEPLESEHFINTIPSVYLSDGLVRSNGESEIVTGTINNDIVYLHFSDFHLAEYYSQENDDFITPVLDHFFDNITTLPNLKGIILDIRSNLGGDSDDLGLLLGHLIEEPVVFGYLRSKQGEGRLDYSPWIPFKVRPQTGAINISVPIVVLADMYSASMAEITTLAVQSLPNGYFLGERTYGATGPVAENTIYNGGQFKNPVFSVYISSLMFKDIQNISYEGIGIKPDIEVKYDQQAINNDRDTQLEKVIELIREKTD